MHTGCCRDCGRNLTSLEEVNFALTLRTLRDAQVDAPLCIGCIEIRLERRLTADDFSHKPINYLMPQSARLKNRLTGKEFLDYRHLPAARAVEHFARRLGIAFRTLPCEHPQLFGQPHCHIELRRNRTRVACTFPFLGVTSVGRALSHLEWTSHSALRAVPCRRDDDRSVLRLLHRHVGRAEIALRQLMTPAERARLRRLEALPQADHVLPRDTWMSLEDRLADILRSAMPVGVLRG